MADSDEIRINDLGQPNNEQSRLCGVQKQPFHYSILHSVLL